MRGDCSVCCIAIAESPGIAADGSGGCVAVEVDCQRRFTLLSVGNNYCSQGAGRRGCRIADVGDGAGDFGLETAAVIGSHFKYIGRIKGIVTGIFAYARVGDLPDKSTVLIYFVAGNRSVGRIVRPP